MVNVEKSIKKVNAVTIQKTDLLSAIIMFKATKMKIIKNIHFSLIFEIIKALIVPHKRSKVKMIDITFTICSSPSQLWSMNL